MVVGTEVQNPKTVYCEPISVGDSVLKRQISTTYTCVYDYNCKLNFLTIIDLYINIVTIVGVE